MEKWQLSIAMAALFLFLQSGAAKAEYGWWEDFHLGASVFYGLNIGNHIGGSFPSPDLSVGKTSKTESSGSVMGAYLSFLTDKGKKRFSVGLERIHLQNKFANDVYEYAGESVQRQDTCNIELTVYMPTGRYEGFLWPFEAGEVHFDFGYGIGMGLFLWFGSGKSVWKDRQLVGSACLNGKCTENWSEQVEREIKIEPASNHLGLIFPLDVSFRVLFPWINLEAQLRYEFQYLGILRHYEGTGLAGFIGYHGPQLLCSYYF